jgi:aldehyde:ferredoxin oxidoreductase
MGKILWVDLDKEEIHEEDVPEEVYRDFLSGYGLGVKVLYENIPRGADPLGPENVLGFCSGLLTGTGTPFSGRYIVVGKSPLTGGWGDANSGGHFTIAIKQAGYDGIFFKGIAKEPVYLYIDGDKKELRSAKGLWGKDCYETEDALRKELGKRFKVACIGPGGERCIRYAGISCDKGRFAARSGLGCVMGSKKLKALAISGKAKAKPHNRERLKEVTEPYLARFKGVPLLGKGPLGTILRWTARILRFSPVQPRLMSDTWREILRRYGTCGVTAMAAESGDSPVKNWFGAGCEDFPLDRSLKISDENVIRYEVKKFHCYACPLGCGGIMELKDGPYKLEEECHKPEYETLCAFGTLCLNDDLESIFKLNDMCNRAGIDTISTGAVVAFAVNCAEEGIINEEETGGIALGWGYAPGMIALLEKIIAREGIGDLLAEGVKIAAEKIGKGSDRFAFHAGGQELPMHDPKFDPGYGLAYSAEPTPGRHTTGGYTWQELADMGEKFRDWPGIPMLITGSEKYGPEGKGTRNAMFSKYAQVMNGAGLCLFGLSSGAGIPVIDWLNATTGWDLSPEEYLAIGERILTLRHCFNLREGVTPRVMKAPPVSYGDPPLERGPLAGVTLDMDRMIEDYFREFDWDRETGMPSRQRLTVLGLDRALEDLYGSVEG